MNPTSIATVSLSGDLADKLRAIAAAGFDGVEVFENDFLTFDGNPRDVGVGHAVLLETVLALWQLSLQRKSARSGTGCKSRNEGQ